MTTNRIHLFFLLIGSVTVVAIVKERCPTDFAIGYLYRELGCEPVHEEASKCPSHFDCSKYSGKTTSACYYKGEYYEIGSEITVRNPCLANCRCVEDRSTGRGVFTCANVECFDYHLETENCTRLYTQDKCCSVKTHCKGDPPLPTCLVDGKVYYEGQKFYPKDEPCKECHCKAGFEGKFEKPFCNDVSCDVELHYAARMRKDCVPIYYGRQGCCPIDWKCPNADQDKVIPFLGKTPRTTSARCKFGDLEFEQYETLNNGEPNISCKCMTPPYLSCINLPNA